MHIDFAPSAGVTEGKWNTAMTGKAQQPTQPQTTSPQSAIDGDDKYPYTKMDSAEEGRGDMDGIHLQGLQFWNQVIK